MPAPTQLLPSLKDIAKLPKRSQIAYAIRCALRVEPLYVDKNPDLLRARFVRACIETACNYFDTGRIDNLSESDRYEQKARDHGANAALFLRDAICGAYSEEQPDYDAEEAEYDEATPTYRVESVATYSLLAVYETSGSLEESKRCERLALAETLADFEWLKSRKGTFRLDEIGPLWRNEKIPTYDARLEKHNAILATGKL